MTVTVKHNFKNSKLLSLIYKNIRHLWDNVADNYQSCHQLEDDLQASQTTLCAC